jgi:putative addiction module component (TIGR02574 family)
MGQRSRREGSSHAIAERVELAEELRDCIAADCEREPWPPPHERPADLARRLAEAGTEPTGGTPWEEARERIRRSR